MAPEKQTMCPHCREKVDPKATRCPHCHGKIKRGVRLGGLLIALLVIWFVGFVAQSALQSSGTAESTATTTAPPATEKGNNASDTLVVQPDVPYEIVKTWESPNGGYGKVIVITSEDVTEQRMAALGETLKRDTVDDRNAFIFVFSDRRAAEMRDKVSSDAGNTLSDGDRDFYDVHYVGQYVKNGNSGYHTFSIYLDGVMGTNRRDITY
jgi:hypothetical protein